MEKKREIVFQDAFHENKLLSIFGVSIASMAKSEKKSMNEEKERAKGPQERTMGKRPELACEELQT